MRVDIVEVNKILIALEAELEEAKINVQNCMEKLQDIEHANERVYNLKNLVVSYKNFLGLLFSYNNKEVLSALIYIKKDVLDGDNS
jgi:hypothetical protein